MLGAMHRTGLGADHGIIVILKDMGYIWRIITDLSANTVCQYLPLMTLQEK